MTQKAAQTLEEKIRRDGSLSEERKTELLRLVSTMKPDMTVTKKSQDDAKGLIKSNQHSTNDTREQDPHRKTPNRRK